MLRFEPKAEGCVRWDDPQLGMDWQLGGVQPLVSPKDAAAPDFANAQVFD